MVGVEQILGLQLHRGQRVLDLVSDLPRHLRPGEHSLGLDQIGEIFDHQQHSAPGP